MTRKFPITSLVLTITTILAFTMGLLVGVQNYPNTVFDRTAQTYLETQGEYGKWQHLRKLAGPEVKAVVRPNRDTIYSSAFVDLRNSDYLLSLPPINSYFSFAIYDENTNVIGYVSSRTHGLNKEQKVRLRFRQENQRNPSDTIVESTTSRVWILGRFLVTGENDYPRINDIQDALFLSRSAIK